MTNFKTCSNLRSKKEMKILVKREKKYFKDVKRCYQKQSLC